MDAGNSADSGCGIHKAMLITTSMLFWLQHVPVVPKVARVTSAKVP